MKLKPILLVTIFTLVTVQAIFTDDDRLLVSLIAVAFAILVLKMGSERAGFYKVFNVLLLTVACGAISYRVGVSILPISIPEMFVFIILGIVIIFKIMKVVRFYLSREEKIILIFSVLYAAGGAIAWIVSHEGLKEYVTSCLLPTSLMFLCFVLIREQRQVENAVLAAWASLALFALLTIVAFWAGYARQMPRHEALGQLTAIFEFGSISYVGWANWFGAMAAMGFSISFAGSLARKQSWIHRVFLFSSLISLYFAYLATTRGGALAILIGIIFIALSNSYCVGNLKTFVKYSLLVAVLIVFGVKFLSLTITPTIEKKFTDAYDNRLETANFRYRIDLVSNAYSHLLTNPMGRGFDTLWASYRMDEANFYSWSADGVGLIGVVGFWGLICLMAMRFMRGLLSKDRNIEYFSIIGSATLLTVLVGGTSSDQILREPQSVLCFWTLMGATLKSISLKRREQKGLNMAV